MPIPVPTPIVLTSSAQALALRSRIVLIAAEGRLDQTADQILDSIARYCERINDSRH